MANRKSHFFYWLLLALVPLLGGAAFFSLRGLSRTPAKIDPEKLARWSASTWPVPWSRPARYARHAGGNQVQGQRDYPEAARERRRHGHRPARHLRAGSERPAAQAAPGAGRPRHGAGQLRKARRPITSATRWRRSARTSRSSSATWNAPARCSRRSDRRRTPATTPRRTTRSASTSSSRRR